MSDSCTHDCDTCTSDCSSNEASLKESLNEHSSVGKVYAIVGGKGGVGKSTVTALLAARMQGMGYNTAVLDADITGPSIPQAFGITGRTYADERGLFPMETSGGTQVLSVNVIIPNPSDPVMARGALVENTIKKFWSEAIWDDVDYMFIDMPSGTGEVPIAVLRHLPVDGIIIVTTPQELAAMITGKTVKMLAALKIPVIGIVENMAYYTCPDCGKDHEIFGDSHLTKLSEQLGIKHIAKMPIDASLTEAVDTGAIEAYNGAVLDDIIKAL